jgi:type IV pilus assembly protein PilB
VRTRLGESLVRAGLITPSDLRQALVEQQRSGARLGAVLVDLGMATEEQIASTVAGQLGFPFVDVPDRSALVEPGRVVPRDLAEAWRCVPLSIDEGVATIAMADPLLFSVVQEIESRSGYRVRPVVATATQIGRAIERCYGEPGEAPGDAATAAGQTLEAAALALDEALTRGATEVRIDPTPQGAVVRVRRDRGLTDLAVVAGESHAALIADLKRRAHMNVAETRLAQDGRFRERGAGDAAADFRVSTVRTPYGERAVIRRLDRRRPVPDLSELGLSPAALQALQGMLRQPRGLVAIAGPRGSGRTTTACAALASVAARAGAVTIEDPVEYQIDGARQLQVDHARGETAAALLRSAAQDAGTVLIGDLREPEAASLALALARTRLVVAVLEADAAASAIACLLAMGVDPPAAASALLGVVAERLVRRQCPRCGAIGCDQCNHTGYRGRVGIFEVAGVTARLRQLIAAGATESALRDGVLASGAASLADAGLAAVQSRLTTNAELARVLPAAAPGRPLCRECGAVAGDDFAACARCGARLGGTCRHCGRALQPAWHYCPYCTRSTAPNL